MRRTTKKRIQNVIGGLVIGGTLGTILSFLLAPKSGKELRGDINEGFNSSLIKVKNSGRDLTGKIKNIASNTLDKLQMALNAGIETYKREGEKVKTSKEILEESLQEEEMK